MARYAAIAAVCLFLAIVRLSAQTNDSAASGYRINGTVEGYADETLLILEYASNVDSLKFLDSARVKNGRFSFSGQISARAVNALIRTKDYRDYRFFWLENSTVSVALKKGKFRGAAIAGSKTQEEADRLNSLIKKNGNEKKQSISFIKNNPNSIVSAYVLSVYASTWGKEISGDLYASLSEEMKNTPYGQNILSFVTLNKALKIGDKFVDFSQQDITGKQVSLSQLYGKVILLEFWGSWCLPCRKENPNLVGIYDEFKAKGFEIFGVASETNKANWLDAVSTDKLAWINVSDLKGDKNEAALIYGVSYYPASFLIDRNGIIIARDLKGAQLRKKLSEILK